MNDPQPNPGTLAGQWEEIAESLLSLEQLSFDMIACPEELLPGRMERRAALIERVQELCALCAECEPADEQEAERVFAARQQAHATACRMKDVDGQVMARMKREQERILEKLRTVGKSAGARASRFYQAQAPAQRSVFHGSI